MKRFFLIFLTLVSVFALASAQKRNAEGLKMVKSVNITYHSSLSPEDNKLKLFEFKFNYDDSNNLISFDINKSYNTVDDKLRRIYRLVNGKLTRKDYENGKQPPYEWFEYEFKDGRIAKLSDFCKDSDGGNGCLRHDTEFVYDNELNGFPRLSKTVNKWYVRMRGKNYFEKGDSLAYHGFDFRLENGDYNDRAYWVSFKDNLLKDKFRDDRYVYSDKVNDTNINWDFLIANYNSINQNLYCPWEMMTEWVPMQSAHLMEKINRGDKSYCTFQYDFDNKNNLVGFKVISYENITREKIVVLFDVKIDYVY